MWVGCEFLINSQRHSGLGLGRSEEHSQSVREIHVEPEPGGRDKSFIH